MKKVPTLCPSCNSSMQLRTLSCPSCKTEVSGTYPFPAVCRLSPEDQDFVYRFVLSSGSLKEMAQQLGLSYPTVRNKLDDIITHLKETHDVPKR